MYVRPILIFLILTLGYFFIVFRDTGRERGRVHERGRVGEEHQLAALFYAP